ncbi:restriction endonuclease subunit S [Lachnoanaerobaculum sp.]
MSYKKGILGDYIDILSGFAFKTKDFNYCGVPVIKIKNICPPYVCLNDLSYVTTELADKQNKFELKFNDVLIAMTGSHINRWESSVGRVARVRFRNRALLNQRVGKVVAKPDVDVCIDYIYYFLSQDKIRTELASKATGSANQANISPTHIKEIVLGYVNVETQIKISHILSAYDDLIENNQKQIKLLEEAAQRLYKEWFIDLRFPGYENVEIVDGVPEGWQYKKVSSLGSVITGKTPSTAKSQYYGGEVPFIKIPDMHKGVFPLVTEITLSLEGANSQKNKFIPKNSIMVSCIATVGLVNISVEDCQTNQQINSIVLADERSLYYLYFAMKDLKSLLDGVGSNGATMTNVNKEKFSNLSILYPDTLLLEKYYEYSKPLFDKILNLSKNINCLTEARERLLPKLMSGEIEV